MAWERNSRLVRGLDYYRHTAFEFVTDRLGAQGTVLGGGRYDGLMESLGGPPTPAVGWAAGIERLAMLIDRPQQVLPEVAILYDESCGFEAAVRLATILRRHPSYLRVEISEKAGFGKTWLKMVKKTPAFIMMLESAENAGGLLVKMRRPDKGNPNWLTKQSQGIRKRIEESIIEQSNDLEDSPILVENLERDIVIDCFWSDSFLNIT